MRVVQQYNAVRSQFGCPFFNLHYCRIVDYLRRRESAVADLYRRDSLATHCHCVVLVKDLNFRGGR